MLLFFVLLALLTRRPRLVAKAAFKGPVVLVVHVLVARALAHEVSRTGAALKLGRKVAQRPTMGVTSLPARGESLSASDALFPGHDDLVWLGTWAGGRGECYW